MSEEIEFNQQDIEILNRETLYQGFFTMQKIQFRHKLFAGGWSDVVTRELLIKGAAAAVVAYDPARDSVILVEQVRIGAYDPSLQSSPWLLELIAGMIEEGETPEQVALRESMEEAGVTIENMQHMLSVWDSPGGVLERIHLFVGQVDSTQAKGIHGLASEHEDIRVKVVSRDLAYQWLCEGRIDNSIAVMGLQWLQLNYQRLQTEWLSK